MAFSKSWKGRASMKVSIKLMVARGFAIAIAALFLLVMVTASAVGQQETGQITGRVVDPQDRVVPGATVTVKSVGTGAERTATADDQGTYIVTNLQPGLYDVTVKSGQFAENTQRVQVTVGAKVSLETKLSTQAVAANVEVVASAGGVEVNTTDQQLSNVVTGTQVRELPTLTRNPYDLVGISGNVNAGAGGRGTGYSINGLRAASTSILLDGVENVDNFTATVGQQVPIDSVQEFRVITGNFGAEYGRASGGIVNVATITASQVVAAYGGAAAFVPTPNAATNAFLAFATANPNTPVFQRITYSTPQDVGGGTPQNQYQSVARVDYNISSKTQLYGRYALQNQVNAPGTNASSPFQGFSTGSFNKNQNFLLSLTRNISPNFVSQSKFGFNRLNGGQPLGDQPLVPTLYMNAGRTV